MMSIASYIEDNSDDYEDGRSEYYISYMYFANDENDEGEWWLKRSYSHEYPDAVSVYKAADHFHMMKDMESNDDEEYLKSWLS